MGKQDAAKHGSVKKQITSTEGFRVQPSLGVPGDCSDKENVLERYQTSQPPPPSFRPAGEPPPEPRQLGSGHGPGTAAPSRQPGRSSIAA